MTQVSKLTDGRVSVGPGTLYNLLESFLEVGWIAGTKVEGRKRSYLITAAGRKALEDEYRRLQLLTADYEHNIGKGGTNG